MDIGLPANHGGYGLVDAAAAAFSPADTVGPTVSSTEPYNGAPDVALSVEDVVLTFSEPLDTRTVSHETVKVSAGGVNLDASLTWTADRRVVTLHLQNPLAPSIPHTVTATTGLTDDSGNPLQVEYNGSFTTAAQGTPSGNLVVSSCSPNNGDPRDQLTVRVTGSGFQSGATASFGPAC